MINDLYHETPTKHSVNSTPVVVRQQSDSRRKGIEGCQLKMHPFDEQNDTVPIDKLGISDIVRKKETTFMSLAASRP